MSISQVMGLLGLRALKEASRRRGTLEGPAEVLAIMGKVGELRCWVA